MNQQELCHYIHIHLNEMYNEHEINYINKYFIRHWYQLRRSNAAELQIIDDHQWVDQWLKSLQQGMPVAYVAGEAAFLDLNLFVGAGVLIPRPETEELCSIIQQDLKFKSNLKILDIGTGSGCIPVYLKKYNPSWKVYALDISEHARDYTLRNAEKYEVHIEFILMDFLKEYKNLNYKLDVIIANPPYISKAEKHLLSKQTLSFEPHIALFPESEDDLIFYRRIFEFAISKLNPKGYVYLELNSNTAEQVFQLFSESQLFIPELLTDLFSKPRFLRARLRE